MQRILGNSYGQLILENQWKSDSDLENIFRLCHKDHKHPVPRKLKTADLNGKIKFFLNIFTELETKIFVNTVFRDKIGGITVKGSKPIISCVKD